VCYCEYNTILLSLGRAHSGSGIGSHFHILILNQGLAPPGCWKSVFVNTDEGGVAWRNNTNGDWGPVLRDENGDALWRPTFKDGTYAEPYRLKPFGSLQVVDRQTGDLVDCGPKTCPKGEKIKVSDELSEDDRARILVDSPHVGKIVNRVPFYWSGG
jgi:hypothetical protein